MPDSTPMLGGDTESRYTVAREAIEQALELSRGEGLTDVATDDDVQQVVAVLGRIVGARKLAEEQRKAITKPLTDEKRQIDNRFKELAGPLDGAEKALKDTLAAHRRKVEAERRARIAKEERNRRERQAREDERAAKEHREPMRHEAPRIDPEPEPTMRSGGHAATVRRVWKAEVIDESLVPRHYCEPDTAAIRKAVADGVREIPGVRIYEDDQVAVS